MYELKFDKIKELYEVYTEDFDRAKLRKIFLSLKELALQGWEFHEVFAILPKTLLADIKSKNPEHFL